MISRPSRLTVPDCGRRTPVMTLNRVVLPDPFGPIKPRISPARLVRSTRLRAVRPPKRIVMSWHSSSMEHHPGVVSSRWYHRGTGDPLAGRDAPAGLVRGAEGIGSSRGQNFRAIIVYERASFSSHGGQAAVPRAGWPC